MTDSFSTPYPTPMRLDSIEERLSYVERLTINLEQRISDCEWATTTNTPANEPEPPVDTSWHPYDIGVFYYDEGHPVGDDRVVVMLRNGEINRAERAKLWDWSECEHRTIVAWRYAKEGE